MPTPKKQIPKLTGTASKPVKVSSTYTGIPRGTAPTPAPKRKMGSGGCASCGKK